MREGEYGYQEVSGERGYARHQVDSGELLSCWIILISAAVPQTRGVQGPASRDCREHVECSFALTLEDLTIFKILRFLRKRGYTRYREVSSER